jgi:aspartate/methionine/tyrosine aminotransferase
VHLTHTHLPELYGLSATRSDEIYALSVWGDAAATAHPFVSLEVIAREAAASGQLPCSDARVAAHLHVVWGLSKDFSASGLRVGCLHTRRCVGTVLVCMRVQWCH